ncbi:MAG: ATP-binding cassette domain-containing protein [Candidatus Scalindua sp.]|jgi:ATPase subunit of ABC transporter with duplicated ATPase domains|nr:ATP-binding cassette domain-containing protein [Candidatus Scalindua sp.]MBT5303492.1 ATP-binding cassette domain-containing protein [Candidatus Scalindua sp.]MBT6051871.1 ATP-binding cassette domain-containing protein [Candidatus Scalindua sp.]MBT6227348.1 ATP-binding cassette domain-containing protein [Candidatus Scalindua sp.]MBT6562795.1 ATP-binding cassette domain-containing protein [Candidatus Scalindua sp.]
MLKTHDISLRYGKRVLFENVTTKFSPGNCYGVIGANGAGKSTLLDVLSGDIEPSSGNISVSPGKRIAVLKQNQYEFDEFEVCQTVLMGHKRLFKIMVEKDAIYAKSDFSNEDGMKVSDLEDEFAELNGWEAESEVSTLLSGLGVANELHTKKMAELSGNEKVKVLLAQALFGSPDILLLDEPTNHLDIQSIDWLEEFLIKFKNTVIVVSHDRHFLNNVCTHIADIDYGNVSIYTGNYDFWLESSQLALEQTRNMNKKTEAKRKELEAFVARFSANASKSKQATSRKKTLEKMVIEEIKPSSRKFPFIRFIPERPIGNNVLTIKNISKKVDGEVALNDITLTVNNDDKIAFVGTHDLAKTALFEILMGETKADSGDYTWGGTAIRSSLPKDNSEFFNDDVTLVNWLRQYSKEKDDNFIRGILGRMLFSGEESLKKANVLSGGEKVRCMQAKMMISGANVLILDEPTNHLDLETITSLNDGLIEYKGVLMFSSRDHQFMQTIANRIIEITPYGVIDKKMTFDEYLESPVIKKMREEMYENSNNRGDTIPI